MMYLNRNKNGYGWYSQVKSKDGDNEVTAYINFSFKKGTEPSPQELTEYGSYQGELIFRDSTGKERRVFPIAKEYNSIRRVDFMLMDPEHEYKDPDPSWRPKTEPKWQINDDKPVPIEQEELPFY